MTMSASLHCPVRAEADNGGSSAWVNIKDADENRVVIFLPDLQGAQAASDAINAAIATTGQAAHDRKVLAGLL